MNSELEIKDIVNSQADSEASICIRIPFWLNADTAPIFCWLHLPKDRTISTMGMVVCNPLGYEYSHSHRTVRHLCDAVAASGQACIRFDYHGTGDSFSDLFEDNRIATFLENIHQVIQALKTKTGVTQICLLGIRLGATLAAEYCKNNEVEQLILWSPCVKGRAYVREMKALEKLASHSDSVNAKEKDFIDSGGFIVTNKTADVLSQINLLKQQYLVNNGILLIERNDIHPSEKLIQSLTTTNIPFQQYSMDGYLDMMAEPQETVIPDKTINKIISWSVTQNNLVDNLEIKIIDENFRKTASTQDCNCTEQLCIHKQTQLFGILNLPVNFDFDSYQGPVIILANSGSVHRVGPNRVYVELARELSNSGFPSFRFDLTNLGDSVQGLPEDENHPYPFQATEDISEIINYLEDKFNLRQFVISGLCSGAHNTFHAGLELSQTHKLKAVILINPLRFYRETSETRNETPTYQVERDSQQYAKSAFDLQKWKKLLSGKVDIFYLFKFAWTKFYRKIKASLAAIFELTGLHDGNQLSIDLRRYAQTNIQLKVFVASKDPGEKILKTEARRVVEKMIKEKQLQISTISNADHTFSSITCRTEFIRAYVDYLKKLSK